jgi:tetratricopeptide (TPR) repeat protein/tRNA A-37 threonylcarbamoyl transferase component Bud32
MCPSDADLLAFAHGSMPVEARRTVEVHLDSCPDCLAVVAVIARSTVPPRGSPDMTGGSLDAPGPLLPDGEHRYLSGPEIARGGMGKILSAEDRLLHRAVALKLLRRNDAGLTRRFRREQRITAKLQHPAIVPIYDAGILPDGQPFFVMRLVKGESLDRTAAKATSLSDRLRLLPAVLGVVDAVAYAHEVGVVHRDLKPQNVLVGPFGEVVLVDWGLARELGVNDSESESSGTSGEDIELAETIAANATSEGEVLGTLAYMSPEQAEGRPADARSDVYGLGAILYHVLSGVPPHAKRVLKDATHDRAEPLSLRVPDLPPDLVAIVERAMAPIPDSRYASAQALSEDLKRWQTGRLVAAHRYTPAERLTRFVRKYRATLTVAAAALVVLLVVGAFGLKRIVVEKNRALAEQARAESALGRAETQRIAAETLVGFVLGDLRDKLERVGRLDALEGVASAVTRYQDNAPPGDEATSLRRAEVAGLAGDVALATGNLTAAEESYRRSLRAAEESGNHEDGAAARCHAMIRLGDVHARRGEGELATKLYEECGALSRTTKSRKFEDLFVQTRLSLADLARTQGDLVRSRKLLEEALPVAIELLAGGTDAHIDSVHRVLQVRSDLWRTLSNSGEVNAEGEQAAAALTFAKAQVDLHPDDNNARYDEGVAQTQVALAKQHVGDFDAADNLLRQALSIHRLLAARDPSNTEWQRAVGVDAELLGSLLLGRGDAKSSLAFLRESEDASARLVAIAPGNHAWQHDLGVSALSVADALLKMDRIDDARASVKRAMDIFEPLVGKGAENADHDLGITLSHFADIEGRAHHSAEANAALARSADLLRSHFHKSDTPRARQELATALLLLAEVEKGSSARAHIDEAMEVLSSIRPLAATNSDLKDLIEEAEKLRKERAIP